MKKSILSNPAFRYIFEVIVIVFSVTLSFYIQDVLNKREKIELKNKGLSGVLMELERDVFHFNLPPRPSIRSLKAGGSAVRGPDCHRPTARCAGPGRRGSLVRTRGEKRALPRGPLAAVRTGPAKGQTVPCVARAEHVPKQTKSAENKTSDSAGT